MRVAVALHPLVVLLLCVACGKNTEPPPPTSGSRMAQTESGPAPKPSHGSAMGGGNAAAEPAKVFFANVCAQCHGPTGEGNGRAAATLNPKPRNYTDAAWQASVTDEELRTIILKGGQAVGKSAMMPAHESQLAKFPEVKIDDLIAIIRAFGKQQ